MSFRDPSRVVMIEALESRRLLAGDPFGGFPLPFQLDFNRAKQGLLDRDGSGTGFTWAQPTKNGDEYNPSGIDLRMGAGLLRIYSSGSATSGSNWENDNTLRNVLTTRFGASSRPWVVSARLLGPPMVSKPHEQAGIIFGPDQDNYVKLVVAAEGNKVGLQFLDEQKFKTGFRHYLPNTIYDIGPISAIDTIDLYFSGDPGARSIRALYRINNGPVKELPNALVLDPEKAGGFFAFGPYAGLMVQHKNDGGGISQTFKQFGIKRGVLVGENGNTGGGSISTGSRRVFNDVRGGSGQQIGVAVRNDGDETLTIPSNGLSITGTDASMFTASFADGLPRSIQPGQSAQLRLTFSAPSNTSLGIKTATLGISSNDSAVPVKHVALRGLATAGTGGTNEPSLQRIMELYQIPINVGDTNPNDVFLNDPPAQPNDEVAISQFRKAGGGDVTIQPIAVFGVSSTPALRFGMYEPGSAAKTTELFTINTSDAQTVNAVPSGTTAFDPGAAAFSLYTLWPGFKNSDNSVRITYQEDQFNAFDAGDKRHFRFYPYKNADGSVLPNTYVFAVEEIDAAKDHQDIVAIISNVVPAAAGPEIGTDNLDGWPAPDRLVFNKFQAGDPSFPSTAAHTQAKVRVRNSGTSNLVISSISVSGPFSVLSSTGAQTVQPGKFTDVLVQFNGGPTTGFKTGAVTINSNDADEPTKVISLAGYHQGRPENNMEPSLSGIINTLFGFGTSVGTTQQLDTKGKRTAVGDEVLSSYWRRANTLLPVTVKQIAAYHTQGDAAMIGWHLQGSNTINQLFRHAGVDAQSLYPRQEGNLGATAQNSFTPSGTSAFGFNVDFAEWSDNTKNQQEQPGGGYGHHLRFFPLKNSDNTIVPDTYLLVMDYSGINYDYNDNIYIISNIRPA